MNEIFVNRNLQSKVKESKVKESKENNIKTFSSETWEYKFALALRTLILKNNDTAKVTDDIQKWAIRDSLIKPNSNRVLRKFLNIGIDII